MHWLTDWLTDYCLPWQPSAVSSFSIKKASRDEGSAGARVSPAQPSLILRTTCPVLACSCSGPVSRYVFAVLSCCVSVSLPLGTGSCWSSNTQMRVHLTGALPTDCCTNAEPGYALLAYSGEPACFCLDVFVFLPGKNCVTGKMKAKIFYLRNAWYIISTAA